MNPKKILMMVMAVMALGAFVLISTTPVTAAGKKKAEQEAVKKSVKKMAPEVDKTLPKGKININTASKEELMTLPGIGPVKADEIIKVRKKAKFKTLDDVINVSGIGEETLNKIKPFLKFK